MSSRRSRFWTAYGMPQILLQLQDEKGSPPRSFDAEAGGGQGHPPDDDRTDGPAQSLALYWMQKRAVDVAAGLAANGVPSHSVAELLRSSNIASSGLMCFEKPIGKLQWGETPGTDVPWDAVMWNLAFGWPDRFGERPMTIAFMSRMIDHQHLLRALDARVGYERRNKPLTTVSVWPIDSDDSLLQNTSQDADRVLASLLTSVLLTAGQPRITAQKVLGPGDGVVVPRANRGDTKRAPEVVLIDLLRRPSDASGPPLNGKSKEYDHRWWVRGHYKMQPYGPQSALRKSIYIFPHTAGPEDKPLLEPPRVNVIRTDPPRTAAEETREDNDGSTSS